MENKIAELQSTVARQESDIAGLTKSLSEVIDNSVLMAKSIIALTSKVDSLTGEVSALKSEVDQK